MEITLRYGARSDSATHLRLGAPKLAAPVVIGEWMVTGDEGRQLVPRGGSAELVRPGLAESGWEWLARQSASVGGLLLLGLGALLLGQEPVCSGLFHCCWVSPSSSRRQV